MASICSSNYNIRWEQERTSRKKHVLEFATLESKSKPKRQYAVCFQHDTDRTPRGGAAEFTIHDGPSRNNAVLARAMFDRDPLAPEGETAWKMTFGSDDTDTKTFSTFLGVSARFEIEMPGGSHERFEWRRRHIWGRGRMDLVRLDCAMPLERRPSRSDASANWDQDGLEIVAFAGAKSRINFIGVGVTGEFGDRWALMAIMSALAVKDYGQIKILPD